MRPKRITTKDGERILSISTWSLLKSIGFTECENVYSDNQKGLVITIGKCQLHVTIGYNRWWQECALLMGILRTPRTITNVETELPTEFESREEGLAWVSWSLDKRGELANEFSRDEFGGDLFNALSEGRNHFHLLPWEKKRAQYERERAEYEKRPHCLIKREWVKVGLRELSSQLELMEDETPVVFQFDGEVLKISVADKFIVMPAQGKDWPNRYSIAVGNFRCLPKRLMDPMVVFSIWESRLSIGRNSYRDVAII